MSDTTYRRHEVIPVEIVERKDLADGGLHTKVKKSENFTSADIVSLRGELSALNQQVREMIFLLKGIAE